jgi:hypothetical protein
MKKLSSIVLALVMITSIGTVKSVHAQPIEKQTINNSSSKFNFRETEPSIIAKMKNHQTQNVSKSIYSTQAYSNTTANLLSLAGLTDSAYLLNYSMLPLREEPLELVESSSLSTHIWGYSPDFMASIIGIINQARAAHSYEYYKTTTLAFNMPTENKATILANQSLKRRADLFGALHLVTLNVGIVKSGLTWQVMVLMEDTYNFAPSQYTGITSIVNNLALYDQINGKIKPYYLMIWGNRNYTASLPFGCSTW